MLGEIEAKESAVARGIFAVEHDGAWGQLEAVFRTPGFPNVVGQVALEEVVAQS
jgi:hypothetical protein